MIIGMREYKLTKCWAPEDSDLGAEVLDVREYVLGRMAAEGEVDCDALHGDVVWLVDLETLSTIDSCVARAIGRLVGEGVLETSRRYGGTISWRDEDVRGSVDPIPAPDYDDESRVGKGRSFHVTRYREDLYDQAHERGRFRQRRCRVGWCDEKLGRDDRLEDHVRYCADHAQNEPMDPTEEVVRLRHELDELQGSIMNLAGVALLPYVRALGALDDARRVMGVAQDANNERYEDLPTLLERIVVYEGSVYVEDRGEVEDSGWAPARARVRESFDGVQLRLRELKRLRRKVAKQALAAGLEDKIKASLVYAGVSEGEKT